MHGARRSRLRVLAVLGLAVVCSVSACGTTVPLSQRQAAGSSGLAADGSQATPGIGGLASGVSGDSAGTEGSTATGTSAGNGSTAGGALPTGGATGSGTSALGSGGQVRQLVNTKPVTVAVFYVEGGNAVISYAFPGSSVSFGDGKKEATAVIDDVNAHGGAGGRKIIPQFVAVQAQNANDAGLQTACQGAVQDFHPVAIFAIFNLAEGLATCARKAHVLLIDVALGAGDEQLYSESRDIAFSPSQMSRNAEQKLVLGLAHQAGKLPAGKPVGVLVQGDDPLYERVAKSTIEPLLTSWHVPYIEQSISNGADTNGMSAAILKYSSSGVDTVVFSLGNGGIPEVLFMQAADQQQYRPAYLMGDSTDTNFVGGSAPANQIKRIFGAGTYPLANVRSDQYPSSPGEKACLAVLNKAIGGYSNRYSSLTGTMYCEIVKSFAFVAAHVTGSLNAASWAQAYHQLGTSYVPVTTFSTNFLPGRMDGAGGYRTLAYGTACGCITYTSPIRAVPGM